MMKYAKSLPVPPALREPAAAARIALVAESFARLLGRPLVDPGEEPVAALWHAPFAVLAHGTEADPVLFFGNARALAAFETTLDDLVQMPSRLTAEMPERAARAALLQKVTAQGYIDDYSGVRISARGRRFMIERAVVWNIVDAKGAVHGQAATFPA